MGKSRQGGEGPDAAPLCEKKKSEETFITLCLVLVSPENLSDNEILPKTTAKTLSLEETTKKTADNNFLTPRYVTRT